MRFTFHKGIWSRFPTLGKFVFVFKIITRDNIADLNAVSGHVYEMFAIRELNAYQREAIVQFVARNAPSTRISAS